MTIVKKIIFVLSITLLSSRGYADVAELLPVLETSDIKADTKVVDTAQVPPIVSTDASAVPVDTSGVKAAEIAETSAGEEPIEVRPVSVSGGQVIDYDFTTTDVPEVVEQKETLREAAPPKAPDQMSQEELIAAGLVTTAALTAAGVGAYMIKKGVDAEKKAATYKRNYQVAQQAATAVAEEKADLTNKLKTASPQERTTLQQKLYEANLRAQDIENRRKTAEVLAKKYESKRSTGVIGSAARKITSTQAAVKAKTKPVTDIYKASKEQAKTDWRYRRN